MGAINGAHRGSAGKMGDLWSGHVSWPISRGRRSIMATRDEQVYVDFIKQQGGRAKVIRKVRKDADLIVKLLANKKCVGNLNDAKSLVQMPSHLRKMRTYLEDALRKPVREVGNVESEKRAQT
jgi:hypothetical protein